MRPRLALASAKAVRYATSSPLVRSAPREARCSVLSSGARTRPPWALAPRCRSPLASCAIVRPQLVRHGTHSTRCLSSGPPRETKKAGVNDALRRAWHFLWDGAEPTLRARMGGALVCMFGAKLLSIQVPFLFKAAVDILSENAASASGGLGTLGVLALTPSVLMALYGVVRTTADGMTQLRNALFIQVTEGALRRISLRTFRHLHELELKFHLNRQTGVLSRVIERGTRAVGTLLSTTVLQVLPLAFEITIVSALLARHCGLKFAAVTIATLSIYASFTFVVVRMRTAIRKEQNAADASAAQRFIDSMINYETVKYFDATSHEERRYDEALAKYQVAATRTQLTLAGLNFGQNFVFSTGLAISMVLAVQEVASGRMGVGDMVMIHGLIFQLTMPLNILGMVYNQVRQATTDLQALLDLQVLSPAITDAPDALPLEISNGRIEFEDVHFEYQEGNPLLRGISFAVEAGQTLALVGSSGSGKSSILRLLYRFYDPQRGTIRIDGQDVRAVQLDSLRRCLAVVPQDVVLFNETVSYNLSYGDPNVPREALIHYAKQAQIHDTIQRMPLGYDTIVGERGLKLSGGEKQRIAIARALRKRAPILLCDEATSAVDTVTEQEILRELRSSAKSQQTCILIAHNLSTVAHADQILVLKHGQVVERGTHDELLSGRGEYFAMWNAQQQ